MSALLDLAAGRASDHEYEAPPVTAPWPDGDAGAAQHACESCGAPATCYGKYEGVSGYGCDTCCGHGNEDGFCDPVTPFPEGFDPDHRTNSNAEVPLEVPEPYE